jgi:hypothetical protein
LNCFHFKGSQTPDNQDLDQQVSIDFDCHCLTLVLGSFEIQFMIILQEDGEGINREKLG